MTTPELSEFEQPSIDDRWLAVYIFYTGNVRAVLTNCVKPLLTGLVEDGLISGYFYLNYWLEGPHVRVRFKVDIPADATLVRARAEEAITSFLQRRPSLYEVKSDFYVGLYNSLFDLEYDDETRKRYTGDDGKMRLRSNNSFSWEQYEPEYDKYGGAVGVELAEWHFQHSTDVVLDSMSVMNLHLRTVLLGYAAQLMMVMCSVFLDDDESLVRFLSGYRDYWYSSFKDTELVEGNDFDRNFDAMADAVASRFAVVRRAVRSGGGPQLPGSIGLWAAHCSDLRAKVTRLAADGKLAFPHWRTGDRTATTDPGQALVRLLSAYLHMTNNRLHVTLTDEAYLAHVLVRVLGGGAADLSTLPAYGELG